MIKKPTGIIKLRSNQEFLNTLEEIIRQSNETASPSPQNSHAVALITFLSTDKGGRSKPVQSGYRGQFYYDGKDWDAVQQYADAEWVYPGQTVKAYLWFLSPEAHHGLLYPGKDFDVREGDQIIAHGIITAIAETF